MSSYDQCGTFGKLRFPTAPGICGRVAVTGAEQDGSTVHVTTAEETLLVTGDLVDFTDVGDLGEELAVTVIDGSHFDVTGTVGTYEAGGYVACHGAPDYWWHDDDPKGGYIELEWRMDIREVGERARLIDEYQHSELCALRPSNPGAAIRANQAACGMPAEVSLITVREDCLEFSVCDPQVVCGSPNYVEEGLDWFRNGKTYAFDETNFNRMGDSRYGFRWQGIVLFDMIDPLWKYPHPPCEIMELCEWSWCTWHMDSGECANDLCLEGVGDRYFPIRQRVEARSSLPSDGHGGTAPALPSGLHCNILTVADLAAANPSDPGGLVILPPLYAVDDVVECAGNLFAWQPPAAVTSWGDYIRMMYCTCAGGRWKDLYESYGVKVNCP